jgi:putative cell wall-binding protein
MHEEGCGVSRGFVGVLAALVVLMTVAGLPAPAVGGGGDERGARALRGASWSAPVVEPEDITRTGPVHPMTPPLEVLYAQEPSYYRDGCHALRGRRTLIPGCVYGVAGGAVDVALVGDSKVGQLFPALQEIALREGWRLRTYTKSSCAFVDAPTPDYPECDAFNAALRTHLAASPPDLVLTGGLRRDAVGGYTKTWTWLRGLGVGQVIAFWDTPGPTEHPARCAADALQAGNPSMRTAAARVDGAHFVDLRDWVCPVTWLSPRCPAVVGATQIYRLGSHMTDGYAATLTDPIHQRLHEIGVARYRPSVDRVGGANRYATGALLSREVGPGGRVFVASGQEYADALTAAARAGSERGAVLLTQGTHLPAATREALTRLQPGQVILVGGTRRITDDVLRDLRGYSPDVRRISGEDRYGTAAELARLDGLAADGTVYVATGADFPDALAAAAQAGQRDAPVLLVKRDAVPRVTASVLAELAPQRVVVAGGSRSVSDTVLQELAAMVPGQVVRRGGADRYATAAALAAETPDGRVLHIASGTSYADALTAAPAAAAAGSGVLLVRQDLIPAATAQAVWDLAPTRAVLAGGSVAVSHPVERGLIRLVR